MDDARLTQAERAEISGALLDVARHGRTLMTAIMLTDPWPGSPARALFDDPINTHPGWHGTSVTHVAMQTIQIAVLAGFDHLAGMAALLRGNKPAAASLSTLTRGGLEVLSRPHWLLKNSDARSLAVATACLSFAELGYSERYEQSIAGVSGDRVTAKEFRQQITAWALRERAEMYTPPKFAAMTSALINDVIPAEIQGAHGDATYGDLYYSQLSAVAHGQSFAIAMFAQVDVPENPADVSPEDISLQVPRELALDDAQTMLRCTVHVTAQLAHLAWPPTAVNDRWRAACDRSLARFAALEGAPPWEYPTFD
ncbi:hypothetical protein ACRAWC_01925 [Leifsonia sp. L25]|uniref:hypothetical protein n=1 Tax=Actinomycetes TaxID=1760 RepID=UPI003D698F71